MYGPQLQVVPIEYYGQYQHIEARYCYANPDWEHVGGQHVHKKSCEEPNHQKHEGEPVNALCSVLQRLKMYVQLLDELFQDPFEHIHSVEWTFLMNSAVQLKFGSKFLIFDYEIPNTVLTVVILVRRDEERLLVLVFDQGFFEVAMDVILLIVIVDVERMVLNPLLLGLFYLPGF